MQLQHFCCLVSFLGTHMTPSVWTCDHPSTSFQTWPISSASLHPGWTPPWSSHRSCRKMEHAWQNYCARTTVMMTIWNVNTMISNMSRQWNLLEKSMVRESDRCFPISIFRDGRCFFAGACLQMLVCWDLGSWMWTSVCSRPHAKQAADKCKNQQGLEGLCCFSMFFGTITSSFLALKSPKNALHEWDKDLG